MNCSNIKRETVIARLIANTRRRKRHNNLVQIARDVRWLENDLGGLKAVSETIGLSLDMLQQFLSVERLCPELRKLVEERKIDLINVVHYMRNFDSAAQQAIAGEVIAGRLSAEDIRVLAPLRGNLTNTNIHQLISRVQKSRNIKVYVAYFRVPKGFADVGSLKKRLEKIVGKTELVSLELTNSTGVLELTWMGQRKLRQAAKKRRLSLRKFVAMIVVKQD